MFLRIKVKCFTGMYFAKQNVKKHELKINCFGFCKVKKTLILPSKIYSRQSIIISSFYKDEKRLENKIFFLDQKTFKLFTFLPFENTKYSLFAENGKRVILFFFFFYDQLCLKKLMFLFYKKVLKTCFLTNLKEN